MTKGNVIWSDIGVKVNPVEKRKRNKQKVAEKDTRAPEKDTFAVHQPAGPGHF